MRNFKIVFCLFLVAVLTSCDDPKQVVYEGNGCIVYSKKLGDKPERGKYIYHTKDQSGTVIIWSDSVFDIGDTLKFSTHCK